MYITEVNGWSFEVISIRARRTKKFGSPYTAVATITITEGVPHIEGLLTTTPFTAQDRGSFRRYLRDNGFRSAVFSRVKKGNRKLTRGKV